MHYPKESNTGTDQPFVLGNITEPYFREQFMNCSSEPFAFGNNVTFVLNYFDEIILFLDNAFARLALV